MVSNRSNQCQYHMSPQYSKKVNSFICERYDITRLEQRRSHMIGITSARKAWICGMCSVCTLRKVFRSESEHRDVLKKHAHPQPSDLKAGSLRSPVLGLQLQAALRHPVGAQASESGVRKATGNIGKTNLDLSFKNNMGLS